MKKGLLYLFFAMLVFNVPGALADESAKKESATATTVLSKEKKLNNAEVKILVNRLKEIRKMDKSDLTIDQRKGLRKEVLGIKEKLKNQDGVTIYLSVGAIIIILLLIILL